MISGHIWKIGKPYGSCGLCPGNNIGQCFRYAHPVDPHLGCPGNLVEGDAGINEYLMVDPRTCGLYQPSCGLMGGDGDIYKYFRFMRSYPHYNEFDHLYPPSGWLLPYTGGISGLGINQSIADLIVASGTSNPTIGSTDLPPDWPWTDEVNGWAGYPSRISIRYFPWSAEIIENISGAGNSPDFQVAVYNMRGDLIGGSGGHIESGEPIDLTYPTTSHGGETGDIMWDLGAIKFSTQFIRYISSIQVEVSALGSQNVGTIVILGPGNTLYNLLINASGGGLHGIHTQTSENVPLTVHLQITESELI